MLHIQKNMFTFAKAFLYLPQHAITAYVANKKRKAYQT